MVGVGWMTIPRLVSEARALVDGAPAWITSLEVTVERWTSSAGPGVLVALRSWVIGAASWLVMLPLRITSALFELVIVVVMSAYLVISLPDLRRFTLSLFPEDRRGRPVRSASVGRRPRDVVATPSAAALRRRCAPPRRSPSRSPALTGTSTGAP